MMFTVTAVFLTGQWSCQHCSSRLPAAKSGTKKHTYI